MFTHTLLLLYLIIPILGIQLESEPQQCNISLLNSESTQDMCSMINENCSNYYYLSKFYCRHFNSNKLTLFIYSLFILSCIIVLLISMSLLVSNYLFKNLNHICLKINLNQQILSFILVPSTNSLPDLINYHIVLSSNSIDLVLGQLIGSLLIMFTIIIGLICLIIGKIEIRPPNLILIDLIWVLVILSLFFYILSDGRITLLECGCMFGIYIIYILFLNLYDKEKEKLKVLDQEIIIDRCEDEQEQSEPTRHEPEHLYNIEDALNVLSNDDLASYGSISRSPSPSIKYLSPTQSRTVEQEERFSTLTIFEMFFKFIDFLFLFMIPVYEEEHCFVKYGTFFQLWFDIEIPMLLNYQFFQFPINHLLPVILIVITIQQFVILPHLSKIIKIIAVSLIGIVTSLIIISNISVIILQALKNLGFLWNISDYLLGLLIFSISNSINDVITNITLSTKINPVLGINSCLGTPLLIILLGIGLNGIIVILSSGREIKFDLSMSLIMDTIGLILTIVFILLYLLFNKWMFDKKIGLFLIFWYLTITGINFYVK